MKIVQVNAVSWVSIFLLAAMPEVGAAAPDIQPLDPDQDTARVLEEAVAGALTWGSEDMVSLYAEPTSVVLNVSAALRRARDAEDPETLVRMQWIQERAEGAALSLEMPVVRDATFEDRWNACRQDPHAEPCLRHRGESSIEVWRAELQEDGSVEISLNLRVIVGGRDMNWGVRNSVVVSMVQRDDAWVMSNEVSRVSVTLVHRPEERR